MKTNQQLFTKNDAESARIYTPDLMDHPMPDVPSFHQQADAILVKKLKAAGRLSALPGLLELRDDRANAPGLFEAKMVLESKPLLVLPYIDAIHCVKTEIWSGVIGCSMNIQDPLEFAYQVSPVQSKGVSLR